MELALPIAIVLSVFLALNIGANNSAASMATAYGAGVRSKREAVTLIAVFALLGAFLAGKPVITTLGKGLVPESVLSSHIALVLVVLLIAVLFISWANIARVPVATTHALVCAIAGVGLYAKELNTGKFLSIVAWWVVTPFIAWFVNYLIGKYLYFKILKFLTDRYSEASIRRILSLLLTLSGCYVAFSAGANNSANSVGPLVGMGLINPSVGAILAGLGMGIGAILFGGRVLDTVGKQITEICILRAISVEFTGSTIILIASIFGIPVSLAEIITSGIIGFSCANDGFSATAENKHVLRIAFFWFIAPFFAVVASYVLSSIYFKYGILSMLNTNL
ncbi:MAG: sulfate permease CysP [Deltaproteobacteria bacterium]|nr:Sulfate permease CysP [bacterium HR37]GIW47426.1 MAG: sulfate permease CysP [Deltaproteobacteria bacterium]